jgi:hypothetical protein
MSQRAQEPKVSWLSKHQSREEAFEGKILTEEYLSNQILSKTFRGLYLNSLLLVDDVEHYVS